MSDIAKSSFRNKHEKQEGVHGQLSESGQFHI